MMLALDFDGVVADGLAECLLSAWNAWHGLAIADFSASAYDAIPKDFKLRFRSLRNFVRHDGHFLVPFLSGSENISRSVEFIRCYEEIPETLRERFRADFAKYRKKVQTNCLDLWIHLHTINADMLSLLRESTDARIISGKDASSIKLILQHYGVFMRPDHIHGHLRDKRPVLRSLAAEAALTRKEVLFCDDNLDNIIEASDLGVRAIWALWGYHLPEEVEHAQAIGRTGMQSDEFVSFVRSAVKQSHVLDAC